MDDQLNEPLELLERIDACRPDSDDLRDESLAPLADELAADPRKRALLESVQRLDAAVIGAMEEVPLPAGLQNRLLAALAAAETAADQQARWMDDAASTSAASTEAEQARPQPVGASATKISRRKLFWTALSLGTAASIGGVALVASRYWLEQELSPARVLDETIAFHAQDIPDTLETKQAPLLYSRAISRSVGCLGWRRVNNFLGRPNLDGIAFELIKGDATGTLYVMPTTVESLKTWPLSRPDATTAGRSMSAWQGRKVMYVLVVDGDASAYRTFIRPSGVV